MKSEVLEAAIAYARQGWPIFPVRADKTPYPENGVLASTTDAAQVRKWWDRWPSAGIGLDCGSAGLMVIDYDLGKGQTISELEVSVKEACGGELPKTKLRSRTPSGGEHHFYALDEGEVVAQSQSKLAVGVDVRSYHSYVILPPSRVSKGGYEWVGLGKPAYRSDEMVSAAKAAREKHDDYDTWIIEPDLPENVQWAIEWLTGKRAVRGEMIHPAVEGQGGDQRTFATAAMLKTLGISDVTALELMLEHWNREPYAQPPWEADELEQKVYNAYQYNTSPPGHVTAAYEIAKRERMFGAPSTEKKGDRGHEWTSGGFRIVDWGGMSAIEPPEWLVPGFLPCNGFGFIAGTFGTYKTFIALDVALTVATGKTFDAGHTGVWESAQDPRPVLFAAGEGRASLFKRVAAWSKIYNDGQPIENFYLIDPVPRILDGSGPAFVEAAQMAQREYDLVVIDTVGRAMQATNENSQEAASAFTAMVEEIQRGLGSAVVAIHHAGKDRGGLRGSSVFSADADAILETHPTRQPLTVALSMEKQKDAALWDQPKGIGFTIEGKDMDDEGTLVAKPADIVVTRAAPDEDEDKAKAREEADEREAELYNDLNEVVMCVLEEAGAGKAFSMTEMAEAVFFFKWNDDDPQTVFGHVRNGWSARNIRGKHLDHLIATGAECAKHFNPKSKKNVRWRYDPNVAENRG